MAEFCMSAVNLHNSVLIWMRTLSMNHSTMHDSSHNTVVELIHFQSNTLEETDRGSEGKLEEEVAEES